MLPHTHSRFPSADTSHRFPSNPGQVAPVLLGQSLAARRLRTQIQRIAPYLRTALLVGEAGSGKEQTARALHAHGAQAGGPFVVCSTLAFTESLFGERPAEQAASLLQSARGGTLYLRSVDELSYPLQGSLQRFLGDRESLRMGLVGPGSFPQQHRQSVGEVRIIAGTQRDLRTLASVGQFRAELYAKLSVLEVRVPALRERTDDLPMIAEALLDEACRRRGSEPKMLTGAAADRLKAHTWRGNLRELQEALVHAAALEARAIIELEHLALTASVADLDQRESADDEADDEKLDTVVQRHVLHILTRCRGNKLRAAELLGISRSTLYRMLDSGSFAAQTQSRSE